MIEDKQKIDQSIFKAYDIRGIVGENLNTEIARKIGIAIAYKIKIQAEDKSPFSMQAVNVGYDGRLSSPELANALISGLLSMGVQVNDLGLVTTPLTYFANFNVYQENVDSTSSVMVTGSHNPPNYNGFKIVLHQHTLYGEDIQHLYNLAQNLNENDEISNIKNSASRIHIDIFPEYLAYLRKDISLSQSRARPLKIAVDAGNGVAGKFAPTVLRSLGCDIIELFCEVDGTFPNHHPDPAQPKNLQDLISVVKQENCDYGIAFDGDGDRLGLVSKNGQIIYADRQIILYVQSILDKLQEKHQTKNLENINPVPQIIFDVKCTGYLNKVIESYGAKAVMYKTGHSLIKAYMKTQKGVVLGGEMSGHIFFNDRWYGFDDAIYTAARLAEIASNLDNPSTVFENLPNRPCTPELNIDCSEFKDTNAFEIIEKFKHYIEKNKYFKDALHISDIDGIRIDFIDGFALARPSNTTPVIVLRFEGATLEILEKIQKDFMLKLKEIAPYLGDFCTH
jgi:phosphomannomutase / phosphoglucomutase